MKKKTPNVRKLTRQGKRSLSLTIPAGLIEAFGWRERQRLVIKKVVGGLEIKDYRTKKSKRIPKRKK